MPVAAPIAIGVITDANVPTFIACINMAAYTNAPMAIGVRHCSMARMALCWALLSLCFDR